VILRPSVPGRSAQIFTAHQEEHFCKVAAFQHVASGERGIGPEIAIMGVFNMSAWIHVEFVPLTEFRYFEASGGY
jgi:hypothetical protein